MKKILTVVVLVVIISVLYFNNQPKDISTIKIGALIPTSGLASAIGEENRQGLEIAKEDLLSKYPGLAIELVYEDTAYDLAKSLSAYKKVKDSDGASMVITGGTKISEALKAVIETDNVLQMGIWTASAGYSASHDLNYRTTALSDDNVPILLKYLKEKDLTKIAIIIPTDEFGQTYKQSFENLTPAAGISIVASEGYAPTEKDFRQIVSKVKLANPNAVFIGGTAPQLVNIIKQIRELGVTAPLISQGAVENKQVIDGAGQNSEGLVYSYYFDTEASYAKSFVEKYRALYNKNPSQYVAEAYVGLSLLGDAVYACKNLPDNSCWKKYLDGNSSVTILGPAKINEKGDLKPEKVFLKIIRGGEFVKL